MDLLFCYDVNVLDIGQVVIYDILILGMVIEVFQELEVFLVLKDVLFVCYSMDMVVCFIFIDDIEYEEWVCSQGCDCYIVILLVCKIMALYIVVVICVVVQYDLNIDNFIWLFEWILLFDQLWD